jgi:Fur family ferric uptake transcriptional regulator
MNAARSQRISLLEDLRRRGVRITAQRQALIETIQEADAHLDAATLLAHARGRNPNVNRATVYRTLELLKKQGLIDELDLMHLNGEKHYYEARTGSDHIHLACFRCGGIEECTSPLYEELKADLARVHGFNVQVVRLEVGGLCRSCRANAAVTGGDQ